MHITDLYIALTVGVLVSLFLSEVFGVVPGGTIVPGFLAILFDSPLTVLLIFLIAFVTFGLVNYVLPRFVILYGRRRFVAVLLIGVLIKLVMEPFYPILPFVVLEFRGIGVIVPGLIANCFCKQGVGLTMAAIIPGVLASFGILSLIYLLL